MIWLLFATLLEVIGDYFFKRWGHTSSSGQLTVGLGAYFGATILWALMLRGELLTKAVTMFAVSNILAAAFVGVFMFQEQPTPLNWLGFGMGLSCVFLCQ